MQRPHGSGVTRDSGSNTGGGGRGEGRCHTPRSGDAETKAGPESQSPGAFLPCTYYPPRPRPAARPGPANPAQARERPGQVSPAAPQGSPSRAPAPLRAAANRREAVSAAQPIGARPAGTTAPRALPSPTPLPLLPHPHGAESASRDPPTPEWESGCRRGPHFLTPGERVGALSYGPGGKGGEGGRTPTVTLRRRRSIISPQ